MGTGIATGGAGIGLGGAAFGGDVIAEQADGGVGDAQEGFHRAFGRVHAGTGGDFLLDQGGERAHEAALAGGGRQEVGACRLSCRSVVAVYCGGRNEDQDRVLVFVAGGELTQGVLPPSGGGGAGSLPSAGAIGLDVQTHRRTFQ
jgi:hypothetical protein